MFVKKKKKEKKTLSKHHNSVIFVINTSVYTGSSCEIKMYEGFSLSGAKMFFINKQYLCLQ